MKKALSIVMLFVGIILFSQELKSLTFSKDEISTNKVSLSNSWMVSINTKSINISQGRISNANNFDTRNLSLSLYLSQDELNISSEKFSGYLLSEIPIKSIARNSSYVGINIESPTNYLPSDGKYYQVLVLKDDRGTIKDIYQLPVEVKVEGKQLSIFFEEPKIEIPVEPQQVITEPIKVKMSNKGDIVLDKEWKVTLDFKNWTAIMNGGEIHNKRNSSTGKLIVDIYLVKDKMTEGITGDFIGFNIASAPVRESMNAGTRSRNVDIKTNITTIVPQGEYYILMTLSEEVDGVKTIVSTKHFENVITL